MTNLMTIEAFKIYAICSAILALNLFFLAGGTGAARSRAGVAVNPEDAKLDKSGKTKVVEALPPDVDRWNRAHKNALENIPIFFAIGLVYALSGASEMGARIYFASFTVTRLLHSLAYIKGLQPWRSIFWGLGTLCLVGMIVQIFIKAFSGG